MKVTEEELIELWKYFQYCCLPSIIMARYAYLDYIEDVRNEKSFYRHENKRHINELGKYLERLPFRLTDINCNGYTRYMNILTDNMEEQFQDEAEELHRAIYLTFKNAKWNHAECLASMHFILAMLKISAATFSQCCKDLNALWHINPTAAFSVYNLQQISDEWSKLVTKANQMLDDRKKSLAVDLNNLRCNQAVDALRSKLTDIDTLRVALRKSYPWSPNYHEGIPYEQSADYLIAHNNQKQENNGMD